MIDLRCGDCLELMKDIPDDIGKTIKSEVDYFPSHKGCKDFEWD